MNNNKCTITFEGCNAPWEKYQELKKALQDTIEQIDKETPWQNHEPKWWLEMMNVDRASKGLKLH